MRFGQVFAKFWIPGLLVPFFEYFLLFRASSGLFRASSDLFRASSGRFRVSSGLFWPVPGGFSKISKIEGHPETSYSVHKTMRFGQVFAKFWIPGLLVPFFEYFLLFRASSWPLPGLSWPLPDLFLASS